MSLPVRQSNLFAAEDFTKVYKAFKDVNFKAYDFDSIRNALIEYLRQHYPEDFNDYIESSEYVAIIELIAYMSTSLAFRTDLNTRENFLDTAERRESILRLARMLSYTPSRNKPAKGLFKLSGVSTSEPIQDSVGRNLKNKQVFWNDVNNPDSFEQFTAILNSAFNSTNPFGRPVKQTLTGGFQTDLYRINNDRIRVAIPISLRVQGNSLPTDIVNVNISDIGTFEERKPDPSNSYHLLYRNDGGGNESPDTGFFLYFKQGELQYKDVEFEFPIENRIHEIDVRNINEEDVYVQEIDDDGHVLEQWDRVPDVIGNNVIFNSMELDKRKIFSVITDTEDRIKIRFADGNFGEVPVGKFRVWFRTSANREYQIRPEESTGYHIRIPYIGKNNNQYQLNLIFGLERTVNNSAVSETNKDIKERAPQVFYTQNRMVNSEDYNVFPLGRGNEIEKIRTINRTHAGHSRHIDINDPTGIHQNIILFGEDGAIYKDYQPSLDVFEIGSVFNFSQFLDEDIQRLLRNRRLSNWYYDQYVNSFSSALGNVFSLDSLNVYWRTMPDTNSGYSGFFYEFGGSCVDVNGDLQQAINNCAANISTTTYQYVNDRSKVKFIDPSNPDNFKWITISSIDGGGLPSSIPSSDGPIELNSPIDRGWKATESIPALRTDFTQSEQDTIENQMTLQNDFGFGYDLESNQWYLVPSHRLDLAGNFDFSTKGSASDSSWILYFNYQPESNTGSGNAEYQVTTRGTRYTFESLKEVRFFFNTEQNAIDIRTGRSFEDSINLLTQNNGAKIKETWEYNNGSWHSNGSSYDHNTGIVLRSRSANNDNVIVNVNFTGGSISNIDIQSGIILFPSSFTSSYTPANGDTIEIEYDLRMPLKFPLSWSVIDSFIMDDGYQDTRKVEIAPTDSDMDGVPDRPLAFNEFVSSDDMVFFERFSDFDGFEYFRPLLSGIVEFNSFDITFDILPNNNEVGSFSIFDTKLYTFADYNQIEQFQIELNSISSSNRESFLLNMENKIMFNRETETFYTFDYVNNELEVLNDEDHFVRIGRSFQQNDFNEESPLYFKWKHFAPRLNRIDPSISNIMDMYALTRQYHNSVQLWKKENKPLADYPVEPTSEDLRIQFSEFNEFKMLSDEIVFHPAKFRVLFGPQAAPELKAKFRVVKLPTTTITNNEIKSRVIDAIDEYFEINNWDFGESFYFTELCSYIHSQLTTVIATVVIVPEKASSQFGDLFQIKAQPDELFLPTARVDNVEIVDNLTEVNLRQNSLNNKFRNQQ